MAYVKIIYQNSPSTATPINAQNLNHMDDGIAENDRRLNELETAGVVNKFNNRTGNVTPEKNDYDISLIGATAGEDGYVPVWRNSGTEEDPDWGFEMEQQGGSGHKILDADGSEMAQEDSLQFADSFVSDDDVNGKTVIENIKEHSTKADYDNATEDGFHVIDDGEDAVIHPSSDDYVEVTADGEKTIGTLLNELASQADFTKLLDNAYIQEDIGGVKNVYLCRQHRDNSATFFNGGSASSGARITTYYVKVSSSSAEVSTGTSYSDVTASQKPSLNTVIRLYYGNKKAVVDLQTTANRCLMSDGVTTVEQAINKGSVSVTADGNKTYDTLFSELHNLIDSTKMTIHSVLQVNKNNYRIWVIDGSNLYFTAPTTLSSSPYVSVTEIALSWGGNAFTVAKAGTGANNNLSAKPSNGTKITVYY